MLKRMWLGGEGWCKENAGAAAAGGRASRVLHAHAAWLTGAVTTAVGFSLHEAEKGLAGAAAAGSSISFSGMAVLNDAQ